MSGGSTAAAPADDRRGNLTRHIYMEIGKDCYGRPQRVSLGRVRISAAEAEKEESRRKELRNERVKKKREGVGSALKDEVSSAVVESAGADGPRLSAGKKKKKKKKMVPRMSLEDRIRLMEGKPPRSSSDTTVVDDEEDWGDLEPFFFDEAEARADHARWALSVKLHDRMMNTLDQILEYDPKHGRVFFTRISFVDLMTFDHDKECPLGPMRYTDASIVMVDDTVCKEGKKEFVQGDDSATNALSMKTTTASSAVAEKLFVPCNSANILSVKIASSDVGFPIQVYGTVIARDSLGRKCVYLFSCDRDHSHLLLTKDEELILTGPKRGLALEDAIYFEIDLKIKGEGKRRNDKLLSKGYLMLDGVPRQFEDEMEVESYALDSMLSRVVVKCAVEKRAVEATIAVEVVQGKFYGEITACTTNIRDSMLLHDSKLVSATMTGSGDVPMLRRVVAVGLMEKLMVTVTRPGVCKAEGKRTIKFTPRVSGGEEAEITCGSLKMHVKVTWSIISRRYLIRY